MQQAEKIPQKMLAAVKKGAEFEKRTHSYVNRTHGLETSTRAELMSESPIRVDLIMDSVNKYGVIYASYVVGRGFSNIDQAVNVASDEIDMVLADILMPGGSFV